MRKVGTLRSSRRPALSKGHIFPMKRAAASKTNAVPVAGSRPQARISGTPAPAGRINILLVEDHFDTREYIRRLLEAAAHHVTTAESAEEALKLAETNSFDLVLSDLGLPDMSGNELMRRLRARFNLPGIALSGYGMENDVEESRKSGFKYHLTKPVSFERLKSLVAEFASNRQKT